MTTPRDLLITALDAASDPPPGAGDLSLALAGAELIDLLGAGAVTLEVEHIVPGGASATGDVLLDEAAAQLVRQAPYETVEDWLWRRGRGLAAAYLTVLTSEGQLTREHRARRISLGSGRTVPADTPARRSALERWSSNEPVLVSLGTAVGLRGERPQNPPLGDPSVAESDEAVATVLAVVHDAVRDLEAERQRRSIEEAAFDNVWRGY